MKKIQNFFIYFLISIQKRINKISNNNQAVYYKRKYPQKFLFKTKPHLGPNFYIDLQQTSYIEFNGRFLARGSLSIIGRNEGKIEIGSHTFFNIGCSISCFKRVAIGDNVMFGEGVKIYDHNHQYRKQNEIFAEQGYTISEVTIGNNCWIGTNVIILKGVTIGDNVVVGAGLVINKDIAPNRVIINKQDLLNSPL